MSDLKPQTESLESLLSTAIGLLMGNKERIGYKPGSVVDKFVDECVERLKDWPYTTSAQPAQAVPLLTEAQVLALRGEHGWAKETIRAIEQAVRSKLGAGVGWQPIETAPMDGTAILLFTGGGVIEGHWIYREWQQCAISCSYDGAGGPVFECVPTHWMPLPPPPGNVGKEGGNV
jgi:hypothetical protein